MDYYPLPKFERYNSFIIQHIDNKTKFGEKILSTSFLFLHSLVKMLKFTSIVGYTSCGPTYIESFLTIFGQCISVLNYKYIYIYIYTYISNLVIYSLAYCGITWKLSKQTVHSLFLRDSVPLSKCMSIK